MSVLTGLLLLGLMVVLARVLQVERRAEQLETRIRALQARVDSLEVQPGERVPAREEPSRIELSEAPPAVRSPTHAPTRVEPQPASSAEPTVASTAQPARPSLEELIGGRWLLFAGLAGIILGVSYFVKFAFDNGWISEPLRVAAGVVAGLLLIAAGLRFRSRGVPLFGQALAGSGIVVLYVSIYAALHFYALIPQGMAFALMVLVTAGAAYLADRERSQPLAALAIVGGFATPLLVGGERSAQVVLFTYIAILIAGTAVIARRHAWPLLGAVSYLGTFLLVLSWFFSSYEPRDWLRTELFLTVYVLLFGYVIARLRSQRGAPALLAGTVLATAPLVYHLASIVLLNGHPTAWLVYVTATTATALVASRRFCAGWLPVTVLLLVGLPMLFWLGSLSYRDWFAPAVVIVVAIYVMHLATEWLSASAGEKPSFLDVVYGQLNGLLLPLTLYFFIDRNFAAWNPWIIAGLSGWNAGLAALSRSRAPRMALSFVALAATLAATALVLAFDGPAVAFGWAAEGVFVGWMAP